MLTAISMCIMHMYMPHATCQHANMHMHMHMHMHMPHATCHAVHMQVLTALCSADPVPASVGAPPPPEPRRLDGETDRRP